MTDFEAIDALLATARQEAKLPPAEQRRSLREALSLSRTQVAQALGVSPSTIGGWESGRDPSGEVRDKYAYFLQGAQTKLEAQAAAVTAAAPAEEDSADADGQAEAASGPDEVHALPEPQPCVLCGQPARRQVAGFPQHLDPAECATTSPAAPAAPISTDTPPPPDPALAQPPAHRLGRSLKGVPVGRRMQAVSDTRDVIAETVAAALAEHAGDLEAATAALVKRAIPDVMALLDTCRKGGRYEIVAHPWMPDILRKQTARGPDQIWEARPKWARPELPPGRHDVTVLDVNAYYLSAFKTHLPIGQLEHSSGPEHDRRRAGVHLITPPPWDHDAVLPNPIGNRDEAGPLWVTEPTLRLLLRLSAPAYALCDPPEIHESYTSGATEGLLEKFRIILRDARDTAIAANDEVTLEYLKAMYSKFVSTMGESNYNRELYRQDWMHIIRSQAFSNLWWKAYKAYDEGLTVVSVMGTDELHVIGDWRSVFPEGRGVSEMKPKDTYTAGTGPRPSAGSRPG
ncbi:helix-turn-helix domain-containing protein [Streptomyces sp. NPDC050564]|uniref:helix-turn-helix domain-containing protein n=1 Tax=Streptomyces sp. NPDC050564 TaxID=3365631 RepID=UPI0037AA1450